MIPRFENQATSNELAKVDEQAQQRLKEWETAIEQLPGSTSLLDHNDKPNVFFYGYIDAGNDECIEHTIFYRFEAHNKASLKAECVCWIPPEQSVYKQEECPSLRSGLTKEGTWSEIYELMAKFIKEKPSMIPAAPME